MLGRFISMTTTPDIKFIYGTFADFEIAIVTGHSEQVAVLVNHVAGVGTVFDLVADSSAADVAITTA